MAKKANLVAVLDIGTTKTSALICELTEGGVDLIGFGSTPSDGLRKGVVINIENTVESIKGALEEAERVSGCNIRSAYVGISGGHIRGQNSLGIVGIKGGEVDSEDVQRSVEAAKAVNIPTDREILHVLTQSFMVDDQDGIRDPVGMTGVRLESKVHIVTGSVSAIQNIVKSVNRVGLEISEIVLEHIAAAEAVLTQDEKDLGVAMLDIGGGTANLVIYYEGTVRTTAVIPVGGHYITSDISTGLRTPLAEAERIKKEHGCAYTPMIPREETIQVPSVGGREPRDVSRQILGRIIEARMEEIINLAYKEISKSGYEDLLAAGVVVTGGTSKTEGTAELTEQIMNMPVRMALPRAIGGLNDKVDHPMYSTAVGLVMYASQNMSRKVRNSSESWIGRTCRQVKKWCLEFF
ncbi:MAG: cell division protein FtsA [Syntrophobacterales bacterium]|jgi:cell division protein FtsA|nr:cell division protein FtsA [Syntrophobacterales bacterium]